MFQAGGGMRLKNCCSYFLAGVLSTLILVSVVLKSQTFYIYYHYDQVPQGKLPGHDSFNPVHAYRQQKYADDVVVPHHTVTNSMKEIPNLLVPLALNRQGV